jgi:hypothetical protein
MIRIRPHYQITLGVVIAKEKLDAANLIESIW